MREGEKEEGELLLPTLMSKTGGNWGVEVLSNPHRGEEGGREKGPKRF